MDSDELNLNCSLLRIGINLWYPYTVRRQTSINTTVYTGFCMDLLSLLASSMNFSYSLVLPPDGQWGDLHDGQWTGLVGLLQRQEVDIILAPLRPRIQALQLFAWTSAFDFPFTGVAVRTVQHDFYLLTAFLWPFHWQVYAVLIGVYCLSAVMLFAISQLERKVYGQDRASHSCIGTAESLYGAILNEATLKEWVNNSSRIFLGSWCILGLVLSSSYTCKLTSLLVNVPAPAPFTSLAEMVSRDDFRWGVADSTQELLELRRSSNPVKQTIYKRLMEFARDDPEVLSLDPQVQLSKVLQGRYAYIGEGSMLRKWAQDRCDVTVLSERVIPFDTYHIYTPKNSSLVDKFDKILLRIQDTGLLSHLHKHWFPQQPNCNGFSPALAAVTMPTVQGPFYVAAGGIALAGTVLLLEWMTNRYYRSGGRVVKASASGAEGRGFVSRPSQTYL